MEFGILLQLVGEEGEELADDGDVVGLQSDGEEVCRVLRLGAHGVVEAGLGGVEDFRVAGAEVLDGVGYGTEIPEGFHVRRGFFGGADVEDVDGYYGLFGYRLARELSVERVGATNIRGANVWIHREQSVVNYMCRHGSISYKLVELVEHWLNLVSCEDHGT